MCKMKTVQTVSFIRELLFVKQIQQIIMWEQRAPSAVFTETILRDCVFQSPRAIHSKKCTKTHSLRMTVITLEWRLMDARSVCLKQ